MRCEVAERTHYTGIRYAQCWEDADLLVRALEVKPGQRCLSIASAGDNSLALLVQDPERVTAVDLSPAQIACLELRVAAYGVLSHAELLQLIGSRPSAERQELYLRCRSELSATARQFWDARLDTIKQGIGGSGRFEAYLGLIRRRVLPLIHSRQRTLQLLNLDSPQERLEFYERHWNSWRWRLMLALCSSRLLSGRFGRDPAFFRYAEGHIVTHIRARLKHLLTVLEPATNPYLQWMLTGSHLTALPYALRLENFAAIRARLDRLEWRCQPLESYLETCTRGSIERFNLSNIFEYLSPSHYHHLLERLVRAATQGARLAYWNMAVPRSRPDSMSSRLRSLDQLSQALHVQDQTPFYRRFVLEEVTI